MKKILVFIITSFFVLPVFSQSPISDKELIIFMVPGYTQADLDNLLDELEMELVEGPTPNLGAMLLRYKEEPVVASGGNPLGPITGGKQKAQVNTETEGAGFNYILGNSLLNPTTTETCNDILDATTQANGGNNTVTAIFDTGIASQASTAAIPYFDPTNMGYNSFRAGLYPQDEHGHGSHIASIVMNNLENANGAIQLKSYKTHSFDGKGSLFNVIKALDFAVTDNVDIINMSFVYLAEKDHRVAAKVPFRVALDRAFALSEMLIIAAAGNEDLDNDFIPNITPPGLSAFPASFDQPNIISVASSNCELQRSYFSNFGINSVDVFAPGENIPGLDQYWNPIHMDGTSQATAFVTKLATYLGSHQTSFDWEATKCAILNSTEAMRTSGYSLTNGYINSAAALDFLNNNSGDCAGATYWEEEQTNATTYQAAITYLSDRDIPTFEITMEEEEKALISIVNINGQMLVNEQVQLAKGQNIYTHDFPKTGSIGLYLMMIQTKAGKQTLKFIK